MLPSLLPPVSDKNDPVAGDLATVLVIEKDSNVQVPSFLFYRSGVTNLMEAESCFFVLSNGQRLPVEYTLLKSQICSNDI